MKRIGNLFNQVACDQALYEGYLQARKGKRSKRACYRFERHLSSQIDHLHTTLMDGSYEPKPYYLFEVHSPKRRLVSAPAFRDRVVQHSIYTVLRPIFDRSFIDQSFGCRVGLGTHKASDYVQHCLQQVPHDSYVLQLDIERYYYSMMHTILRRLIERRIKDKRLIDVVMMYAGEGGIGVPIGNLMSQLFGLIYLNPLDHFVKRVLKVKYYARYVDDFVLIGLTHEQAIEYRQRIIDFLDRELSLKLSYSSIYRASRGINFVGFRAWASKRFVRKRALYTFRRAAKRGHVDAVVSSLGHAGKTASRRHMIKHLQEHHRSLYHRLPMRARRLSSGWTPHSTRNSIDHHIPWRHKCH